LSSLQDHQLFHTWGKDNYFGVLYIGHIDSCKFVSAEGVDRGATLSFDEIDTDADNGTHRYNLQYLAAPDISAGKWIVFWNTTAYDNSSHAWDNDELYLLHGMGIEETATRDILGIVIALLFFSLPEVPLLVNVLIATPMWACIIFLLWFIIKETMPFV